MFEESLMRDGRKSLLLIARDYSMFFPTLCYLLLLDCSYGPRCESHVGYL